jgi:hypothetical protein
MPPGRVAVSTEPAESIQEKQENKVIGVQSQTQNKTHPKKGRNHHQRARHTHQCVLITTIDTTKSKLILPLKIYEFRMNLKDKKRSTPE